MTDEQLAAMHRLLALYHRNLAKEAVLDIVQQYHADLAQRLADEAAQIPRRTPILERFMNANNKTWSMAVSTNDVTRIGVMQGINGHVKRVFDSSREDKPWGRWKLKKDAPP